MPALILVKADEHASDTTSESTSRRDSSLGWLAVGLRALAVGLLAWSSVFRSAASGSHNGDTVLTYDFQGRWRMELRKRRSAGANRTSDYAIQDGDC
jgi:hypothetical protein